MDETANAIAKLPSVERWRCDVGSEQISWTLPKGGRHVRVLWDKYLRPGDNWIAWSEGVGGKNKRTLATGEMGNQWRVNYKKLVDFFSGRRP
jgi:hypothetical protein